MKSSIIAPAPLYTFLSYCNDSPTDEEVLVTFPRGTERPFVLFLGWIKEDG